MHRRVGLTLALLLGLATVAQAASTINVGNHLLQPNLNGTAANTIDIIITGNDTNIQGFTLNVQVGDGGPLGGGSVVGPGVSTGPGGPGPIANYPGWAAGLFNASNTGISDTNFPVGSNFGAQLVSQGTTTVGSAVLSDVGGVILVKLTFDTTGFSTPGDSWALLLTGGNAGDSSLGVQSSNPNLTIINGTITIVPEPTSVVLGLFAAAGLAAVAVRKNRARRA